MGGIFTCDLVFFKWFKMQNDQLFKRYQKSIKNVRKIQNKNGILK